MGLSGRRLTRGGGHMNHASLKFLAMGIAIGCLAISPMSGQSETQGQSDDKLTWESPRTPYGRPDLQGYWTPQTFTPLERPERLADKEFFTEEEVAAL